MSLVILKAPRCPLTYLSCLAIEEERQAQGISAQLIRFSTGIEALSDLQDDIANALKESV